MLKSTETYAKMFLASVSFRFRPVFKRKKLSYRWLSPATSQGATDQWTIRRMDGGTNGPTDGPTDAQWDVAGDSQRYDNFSFLENEPKFEGNTC